MQLTANANLPKMTSLIFHANDIKVQVGSKARTYCIEQCFERAHFSREITNVLDFLRHRSQAPANNIRKTICLLKNLGSATGRGYLHR